MSGTAPAQTEREAIQPTLESVRKRELIFRRERSAFANAEEYIFKHALLRDVAYETVLLKNRREFHNRVAHWLESHAEERLGEYVGLIAEHYLQAGENLQAAVYLERSGEEARQAGDFRVARSAFDRALALREAIGETNSEASLRISIRLGEACCYLGDIAAAEAALNHALSLARRQGDGRAQAEALYWLSMAADSRGDFGRAQEILEEALPLARTARGGTLARVLEGLAIIGWRTGDLDAGEAWAHQALSLAQELQDSRSEGSILKVLGLLAELRPALESAKRYYDAALALARKTGKLSMEEAVLNNLGSVAYRQGNFLLAHDYYRSSLDISRQIGKQQSVAITLRNLSEVSVELSDLAAARSYVREALTLAQKIGAPRLELIALISYTQVLAAEGDTPRALALLGLVRRHPSTTFESHQDIDRILAGLSLDEAEIQAGLATGASLDLNEVVSEILSS
jgi:tetratricopeptide (TPR) repeat protein